jgi:hypothetical protein
VLPSENVAVAGGIRAPLYFQRKIHWIVALPGDIIPASPATGVKKTDYNYNCNATYSHI